MKIVLAPDKFKGSLTGLEFCDAAEEGFKTVFPQAEIIKLPLADGGDGTIEVIDFYLEGNTIHKEVNNPFFQPVKASYLYSDLSKIAYIEMAEASGIKILDSSKLDCKNATTFGTGELIADAIDKGAKTIILGIGGSATNDCGIGMATALGYKFLDKFQKEVRPIGKNLSKIVSIDHSNVLANLRHVDFKIACDVSNQLYGINGAAYVYAKQKGASEKDIEILDQGLRDFSKVLDDHFNVRSQDIKGAGAAGGIGIGSHLFLDGNLSEGIELIKGLAQFDDKAKDADWIITGEGKLDEQTLSGKTINGVIKSAKKLKIPVAALCGDISLQQQSLEEFGISYTASILDKAISLEDAMKNSYSYITDISIEFSKNTLK